MPVYKTLKDIGDVTGKRVLVRSELNVPVKDGKVSDTYRIEKAVPTLTWLAERGARVIVMAHLGRNPHDSLLPVYDEIKKIIPKTQFVSDLAGDEAHDAVNRLNNGEILLLENVRCDAREKRNDDELARILAGYADMYVNDAFGVMHREHTSIVGVPKHLPAYVGLLVELELSELHRALKPDTPSLFILGGAKFKTKEALLGAVCSRYDNVFIGGALGNDFLKATGHNVGTSLTSEGSEHIVELMSRGNIILPNDVVVEGKQGVVTKSIDKVRDDENILDIGPESITELGRYITKAAIIVWNGPLGFFEGGFKESTTETAQLVADASGYSIIGGGDTEASIRDLELNEKINFISTGGGAMLNYLVDGKLPGVEALSSSSDA